MITVVRRRILRQKSNHDHFEREETRGVIHMVAGSDFGQVDSYGVHLHTLEIRISASYAHFARGTPLQCKQLRDYLRDDSWAMITFSWNSAIGSDGDPATLISIVLIVSVRGADPLLKGPFCVPCMPRCSNSYY